VIKLNSIPAYGRQTSDLFLRAVDIAVSSTALVVLLPLFVTVALMVKVESQGPAFFRQERVGRYGRIFNIWKFRSMFEESSSPKSDFRTGRNDRRITRVGRVLRASSIDELPQLINVLMGHMTFIGPRPTLPHQAERYDDYQRRRLEVRPGITSLASTKGRNRLSWADRIDLDVWYVDNRSLILDMKILLRTFWVAFVTRDGVYADGDKNDDFV